MSKNKLYGYKKWYGYKKDGYTVPKRIERKLENGEYKLYVLNGGQP